jgi:hypothetical protein
MGGMGDTYDSAAEADADRAQQRALLSALGAWDRALRRDECGAWTLVGSHGTIHTWGDGKTWVLYVACRSALHWTYTKRRLPFAPQCWTARTRAPCACISFRQPSRLT